MQVHRYTTVPISNMRAPEYTTKRARAIILSNAQPSQRSHLHDPSYQALTVLTGRDHESPHHPIIDAGEMKAHPMESQQNLSQYSESDGLIEYTQQGSLDKTSATASSLADRSHQSRSSNSNSISCNRRNEDHGLQRHYHESYAIKRWQNEDYAGLNTIERIWHGADSAYLQMSSVSAAQGRTYDQNGKDIILSHMGAWDPDSSRQVSPFRLA
jgi:hypothetical protein